MTSKMCLDFPVVHCNKFLQRVLILGLVSGTDVWLGAADVFSEGKWVWMSSGNLVSDFKDWFQSEPNNGNGM